MYDDNPVMQTPFFTEINGLDQTALVLHKWEYNPENQLMEVALETKHKGSDHIKPTFSFAAKERESLAEYPVEVVYREGEYFIIQIKNVPKKYRVVGLFVRETRDKKMLESEMKMAMLESSTRLDQDEEILQYEPPKPKEKILVGDYRKIKTNKNLKVKDVLAYQVEQIEREIKQVEKKIMLLEDEKIPLQEQLIVSIKNDIQAIEEDMKYKTEAEKRDAQAEIKMKHEAIKNAMRQQEEHQKEIQLLQEKKEKLLEKLNDIRNGDEKESEQSVQNDGTLEEQTKQE